jgi:hypothetical protein
VNISPEKIGCIAIQQLNYELWALFAECKTTFQAYNTASAIHRAIEKEKKSLKEQNFFNDIAHKKAEEVIIGLQGN